MVAAIAYESWNRMQLFILRPSFLMFQILLFVIILMCLMLLPVAWLTICAYQGSRL